MPYPLQHTLVGAVMSGSRYTYPGCGRIPPVQMEDVPLGEGDVLLHLREGDELYMLITADGTWMHVVACVIDQMLRRPHLFNLCLEDWVVSLRDDPVRLQVFASTLRAHGVTPPLSGARLPKLSQNNPTTPKGNGNAT
ncbi:hypothetical protein Cva_01477 [Caedimonas varicaedens]|uniref:Uncharacterized protein n=1 Tax=Caedimonas varicaedens TaxID=1629334 RepID=A0A0K8MEZ8_9PROT|nr:hypothetical protein Cva_01477 [Caedimonas varicaedens]